MSIGGFIFCLALIAFARAGAMLASAATSCLARASVLGRRPSHAICLRRRPPDQLAHPGGRSLGETAVDDRAFRVSVGLIGALAIPAPFFYAIFAPFSQAQHEAFRLLQFGIVVPTLIFAVSLVAEARARRPPVGCPGATRPSSRWRRRSPCSRSAA